MIEFEDLYFGLFLFIGVLFLYDLINGRGKDK